MGACCELKCEARLPDALSNWLPPQLMGLTEVQRDDGTSIGAKYGPLAIQLVRSGRPLQLTRALEPPSDGDNATTFLLRMSGG